MIKTTGELIQREGLHTQKFKWLWKGGKIVVIPELAGEKQEDGSVMVGMYKIWPACKEEGTWVVIGTLSRWLSFWVRQWDRMLRTFWLCRAFVTRLFHIWGLAELNFFEDPKWTDIYAVQKAVNWIKKIKSRLSQSTNSALSE